jgi:two-component system, cell cycle response regulator
VLFRSHDRSACNPSDCLLPVDSDDEVGSAAAAFNRLVETLSRSHEIEDAMREFSSMLSTSLDLETLGECALRALMVFLKADSGALLLLEPCGLKTVASTGGLDPTELLVDDGIGRVIRERAIAHVDAAALMAPQDSDCDGRQLLVAPIEFDGMPLGAVVLDMQTCPDADQLCLLDQLRMDLGLAVNNARAHERLEVLAAVDPLTDAYNRRFGLARLEEELARSARSAQPVGLLMFDVDRFKAVNDTYGHAAGDRVLRAIADAARSVLRTGSDMLVRYGGEEFLVMLTGICGDSVPDVAERLRLTVNGSRVAGGCGEIGVTVSVGVAVRECDDIEDSERLLARADAALYEAKAAGRNRVAVAPPSSPRDSAAPPVPGRAEAAPLAH